MGASASTKETARNFSRGQFTPIEIFILMVVALGAIFFLDSLFYSFTLEDSYITYRYSIHFAEGHGLGAWNTSGERVEGYTTFLWMIFLGVTHWFGLDVRTVSKIAGILAHMALCGTLIAFPLLRRKIHTRTGDVFETSNETVFAGLYLSGYLPLCWYATTGMETLLFAALTGLAFIAVYLRHSAIVVPLVAVLLILTRPEGVLVAGAAILLYAIICKRDGLSLRGPAISTICAAVAFVFLMGQRLIVFGELVPNTYWAKAGGAKGQHLHLGIAYIRDWLQNHLLVVFLCLVSVLGIGFRIVGRRFRALPWGFLAITSLASVFVLYIAKVGGDNEYAFPVWRHFSHISALIVFLLCYTLARFRPSARYFHLLTLAVVMVITNWTLLRAQNYMMMNSLKSSLRAWPNFHHEPHNEYMMSLKRICQSDTVVASALGGELPYVVDAVHIDTLGLSTSHIAKEGKFDPKGPLDSKTDMKWVMEQHPDLIDGYIHASLILRGNPDEIKRTVEANWRYRMLYDMLSSPIFQEEYLFARQWPYKSMDRALFVRRSFAEKHQLMDELGCVPVSETPLSIFAAK